MTLESQEDTNIYNIRKIVTIKLFSLTNVRVSTDFRERNFFDDFKE